MAKAIERRVRALESLIPKQDEAQELPRWLIESNKWPEMSFWLHIVATNKHGGHEEARRRLHDRFGADAESLIEQYICDRQRMLDKDDC